MDPSSRYLWIFVAALVFLGGLFTWSTVYRHANTFAVGTTPTDLPAPLDPALPAVRASDARLGSTQADAVEIVEFGDYRCLHCKAMTPDLLAILSDSTRNVRLIWREAPVQDQSREGLLPFAASRCAQAQNKFAEMHPALYQLGTLNETAILEAANRLNMNMPQFQQCLNDTRTFDAIKADQRIALGANITAAPTSFVRGKPYVGQLSREALETLLR